MADDELRELVDRERIGARLTAYSTALDDKDWPLVEQSFATGGIVDYLEYGGEQTGARIIEHLRGGLGGLDATQHLIANLAIELDGDRAGAVCALQARHILGTDCYTLVGRYEDALVREVDGVWRLARRTLRVFFTEGDPDVFMRGVDRLVATGGEEAELAIRWRDSVTLG
ncbi:MAG: nuclear transport factor 2 family protein [Actinobacteria bacterium]|nr:nuclear transport factor 2 family protein [Actinomycetota bacterium]